MVDGFGRGGLEGFGLREGISVYYGVLYGWCVKGFMVGVGDNMVVGGVEGIYEIFILGGEVFDMEECLMGGGKRVFGGV